jgi:hypothetical protein
MGKKKAKVFGKVELLKQALSDILDWALSRDGSSQTDEKNLEKIAKIAANALGVCHKCGNQLADHNDDGSCVRD